MIKAPETYIDERRKNLFPSIKLTFIVRQLKNNIFIIEN